jgi:hypothetical protein
MSDVRKPDFDHAGPIAPHVAITNSLRASHTEKLAFLPAPLSAFFLKPACCLKNCDRSKKSSFSTVSAQSGRNQQDTRREHCCFDATSRGFQRKEGNDFRFPIPLPTFAVVPRSGYNDDTVACGSVRMCVSAHIALPILAYGADDAIPPTGDSRITFRGNASEAPAILPGGRFLFPDMGSAAIFGRLLSTVATQRRPQCPLMPSPAIARMKTRRRRRNGMRGATTPAKGMKKISYNGYWFPPEIAAAAQDAALVSRRSKIIS